MNHWKEKSVFITGGGSGIGKCLAMELAQRGADVCIADIDFNKAREVAGQCKGKATAIGLDICDATAVAEKITSFAKAKGRLDFLFNNAGIGISGESYELTVEHWNRITDINIRGTINCISVAYPLMVRQKSGHIINTASLAGLEPTPFLSAYTMTKHAVVGLSKSLRIEAADLGVKVSVLCPAAIETPMLDAEHPDDLNAVSWKPNIRRLLTKLAGAPYPVEKFVQEILVDIEKNKGVIIAPARARTIRLIGRLFPSVVEKTSLKVVREERGLRQAK